MTKPWGRERKILKNKKKKKEKSNRSWGGVKVSLTSKQAAGGAGFYSNITWLRQREPCGINQLLEGFFRSTDVWLKVTCPSLSFWALFPHFVYYAASLAPGLIQHSCLCTCTHCSGCSAPSRAGPRAREGWDGAECSHSQGTQMTHREMA